MNDVIDNIFGGGSAEPPSLVAYKEEKDARFGRTLAEVAPLVPEEQDPNVLFRNNWLSRGQAVQLVASSGVGKSSMTMQSALKWAAGEEFLAAPMKPLKCAIIQAEDSERDVAEQLEGMKFGLMAYHGWSEQKFNDVINRVLCPTCFIGVQGDEFIRMLGDFQAHNKCDMLFINPVQAFFGGDVADQEAVSHWARGGIDPIIKDARHPCGVMVVCHTTKFTSGDAKGRANVEDYGEYIGAGSHEWLDWVRAKFVFLKHGKSETYFDFKAAKRGKRLKWTDENGEPTTTKMFKHTDGHIFWQEVESAEEVDGVGKEPGHSEISEDEARKIAERQIEWIRYHRSVKMNEFNQAGGDAFAGLGLSRAQKRAGGNYLKIHYEEYHMTKSNDGIGFAESHRVAERQRVQQWKLGDGI